MSMSFRVPVFPIILTAVLSACAAGGGGGQGSVVGQLPPTQTVVMDVNDSASTATLTHDASGNLSGIDISTPQSTLSFGPGEIHESFDEFDRRTAFVGTNADATTVAVVVDPAFYGWNYQSFGVWLKDFNTNPFQAGAVSFGAATPGSALPTQLTDARFTGHAGGFYFDGAGNRFATDAQMSAVTDFKNRNIQFSTTGTLLTDTSTFARTENATLDLRGNWRYEPGTSQFSGSVNTVNNDLKGSAAGRFYGPNAEEIGGTYGLTGNGASMLGGFGGKR